MRPRLITRSRLQRKRAKFGDPSLQREVLSLMDQAMRDPEFAAVVERYGNADRARAKVEADDVYAGSELAFSVQTLPGYNALPSPVKETWQQACRILNGVSYDWPEFQRSAPDGVTKGGDQASLIARVYEIMDQILADPEADDYAKTYANAMRQAEQMYGVDGITSQILYVINNLGDGPLSQELQQLHDDLEASGKASLEVPARKHYARMKSQSAEVFREAAHWLEERNRTYPDQGDAVNAQRLNEAADIADDDPARAVELAWLAEAHLGRRGEHEMASMVYDAIMAMGQRSAQPVTKGKQPPGLRDMRDAIAMERGQYQDAIDDGEDPQDARIYLDDAKVLQQYLDLVLAGKYEQAYDLPMDTAVRDMIPTDLYTWVEEQVLGPDDGEGTW